ncbi:MAG: cold shock domain-containing protein [Bdellovibrionales bacterium]|nr:cold shock domain-containing protein [Bdellovibrionales bacterium]
MGTVKFYSVEKGFGFIAPDAEMEDLFFPASSLGGITVFESDFVQFEISEGPKGPVAVRIKVIDKE